MTKKLFFSILLPFSFISFFAGSYQEPEPQIAFFEKTHDFDTTVLDESYEHDFHFVNTGDGPLHIERAKTACKCLPPSWPDKLVQPGDTAAIHVDFYPSQVGDFFKSIQVKTNLPDRPLQLLYVKGTVVDE